MSKTVVCVGEHVEIFVWLDHMQALGRVSCISNTLPNCQTLGKSVRDFEFKDISALSGLWLGMSIVSVLEFVILIIILILYVIIKPKRPDLSGFDYWAQFDKLVSRLLHEPIAWTSSIPFRYKKTEKTTIQILYMEIVIQKTPRCLRRFKKQTKQCKWRT